MVQVKRYLLHEIRLKALALTLAFMLWFSMTYVGESKMGFLVPVSFENLSRGMIMRETDTRNVMITVNGPLSVLKNLKADDIKVSLNLSRAREGREIFTIRKGDVIVPNGLKVENAAPDYVVVELDKLVEKHLPIVVKLDKRWAHTYEVASWYPTYADVEGPRELLEKGAVLETLPVNGNFTRQQEVLDIPLNAKSLEARKVAPTTVRVVLRRIGKVSQER
jgi:YbbR domain-containing protein